jgi:peptidoglycan/LPS O-acetylase OafA/YrhL
VQAADPLALAHGTCHPGDPVVISRESPVQVNPWGVVSVVLIGAVVLLIRVAVRRATADDRPDHHEPGRRIRDMTPAAKVVAGLAGSALVGVVVGRSLEPTPGWFWWCALVVVAGAVFVAVSEHRRVRRDPRLPEYRDADPASGPAEDR